MEWERIFGLMAPIAVVSGVRIEFMGSPDTFGVMVVSTKVIGRTIK